MSAEATKLRRVPWGSSAQVHTPFSPEETEAVRAAAQTAGMETGAWIRAAALAALPARVRKQFPE